MKIIPPSVHNTLEGDEKNMEKDKPTKKSDNSERKTKEETAKPLSSTEESPKENSVVPEEDLE